MITRSLPSEQRARYAAIAAWAIGLVALAAWHATHPSHPLLPLPPAGSVAADYLPDGTPVWVVAYDDGTAGVFEATSTHRAYGLAWAVGWCEEKDAFIDYWGASRWDKHGRYVGGPAPSDLTSYEIVVIEEGSVAVDGRMVAPRRTYVGTGPLGGVCTEGDPTDPATWGDYHVANDAPPVTVDEATTTLHAVVLEGVALFGPEGGTFCSAEFEFDPVARTCDGTLLSIPGTLPEDQMGGLRLRLLATVWAGALTNVVGLPGAEFVASP